ncbi:MAG TPA: hypothetical protein VMR62_11665 [Bryobacteraceae bacterium]|jgi:hypothetical protein|nr:hypothetical protein [Bryobacteraceae bacterium]
MIKDAEIPGVSLRQLNLMISREAYFRAKDEAARTGMFLKRWVQDAIMEKADRDQKVG